MSKKWKSPPAAPKKIFKLMRLYVVAVAVFVAVEYSKVLRRIICLYSFPAASYI